MKKESGDRWMEGGGILCLVIAVAIYGYTLSFDYVLDDQIVITENEFVQKGWKGIKDILSNEGFVGYFGERRALVVGERYRPLSLIMFALERELTTAAWLGHGVNVLLYGVLVFLVFCLIRQVFERRKLGKTAFWVALFSALIYTLHPTHVEAVANIKGRDEILVTLFCVLSLFMADRASKRPAVFLPLLGLTTFLACMSKEQGVTLLVLVPLAMWLLYKSGIKWIVGAFVIVALGVLAYLTLRYQALGYVLPSQGVVIKDLMNNPFYGMTTSEMWGTRWYVMLRYLGLLFFPVFLTHDYYPFHIAVTEMTEVSAIISVMLHGALMVMAFFQWKKRPWLTFSIVFYLVTLLPASNMLVSVGTFMNERFLFLPSLGYALVMGAVLGVGWKKKGAVGMVSKILLVVMILGYGLRSLVRIPAWRSNEALNQAAIKVSPNSARINLFVATDYFNQALADQDPGRKKALLEKAKRHLEKSVDIYPLYASAHNMLSGTCAEIYKLDSDIQALLNCLSEVAAHRPDTDYLNQFLKFLEERGDRHQALVDFYIHVGFNRLFAENKNFIMAIQYLRKADDMSPGRGDIYEKLAEVYFSFGEYLQKNPNPKYPTSDIIESGRYFANKANAMK